MGKAKSLQKLVGVHREFMINLVSLGVATHGAFIIASTLLEQISIRHSTHTSSYSFSVPLFIGFSLVYLSSMLWRRKHTAWLVALCSYVMIFALNIVEMSEDPSPHIFLNLTITRGVVLPVLIVALLTIYRASFVIKSDTQGFRSALRTAISILLISFVYGVVGFTFLDKKDFHRQITLAEAAQYTVDQFDLTVAHPAKPYTKRAHIFVDSLSVVSVVAVGYAVIALFQPLRWRFIDQTSNRELTRKLLNEFDSESEDFFKLWPHDKQYFVSDSGRSVLAYHVSNGVALCLGDPTGDPKEFSKLLEQFSASSRFNDWQPAHIHVTDQYRKLFEKNEYTLQKIGQEAVLDLNKFKTDVSGNKYFRHIRNRFEKQGYVTEFLKPPHHNAVVSRLKIISDEWLSVGGRTERKFAMGYFTPEYMQMCEIMVVRDAAGTIQAFLNMIPAEFDTKEATYDLLRHAKSSPGNINDFLLLDYINSIADLGYSHLNMGLCPLVGLDKMDKEHGSFIDSVLRFAYANGNRVYSFSGLQRFKAKYEPEWRDRFLAYKGGLRGISKATTALMRSMRVK